MSLSFTPFGAARTVTGSRHLVECDGRKVLVDCGLVQERELASRNWEDLPVPAASLDAVLLTHAHADHCAWLPRLVRHGFRGPVFATSATAAIVPIILEDSARLQAEDASNKRKRHLKEGRTPLREVQPLYDLEEVEETVGRLRAVEFEKPYQVAPGLTATWDFAGHLLLEGGGRRLLLSGDLGRWDRPLLPDPAEPPAADLTVIESTYGDRLHDPGADVAAQLAAVVGEAVANRGALLVPCFAVERAQELLWHLANLHDAGRIPEIPVYLDSPMAVRLLEVFAQHPEALDTAARRRLTQPGGPFSFHGLRLCSSREDSKKVNDQRGPCVIIAGSGMCNGGRIKHHLDQRIDDPSTAVLFTGYQAAGTLGRQLVEGARQVRLFGRLREVRARVVQVQGFSGHADRDELLRWLAARPDPRARVAVVHGGERIAPAFAATVTERLGAPAHAPQFGETVVV
jgi:metallo-beta-lactamase family protein